MHPRIDDCAGRLRTVGGKHNDNDGAESKGERRDGEGFTHAETVDDQLLLNV